MCVAQRGCVVKPQKGGGIVPSKKERKRSASGTGGKYERNVKPRLEAITGWARAGETEKEIAARLQVAYSTFREYKAKYPELAEALRTGEEEANATVEGALYKRANGYTVRTYKSIKLRKPVIEAGKKIADEEVLAEGYEDVHVPADTKAIIFWLINRAPGRWRAAPDTSGIDALKKPNHELLEMVKTDAPDVWAQIRKELDQAEKSSPVAGEEGEQRAKI